MLLFSYFFYRFSKIFSEIICYNFFVYFSEKNCENCGSFYAAFNGLQDLIINLKNKIVMKNSYLVEANYGKVDGLVPDILNNLLSNDKT